MTRIGGNDFFVSMRGAKAAGSRRGLVDGARILDTPKGFCLLNLGEGASDKSYGALSSSFVVAEMRGGKWRE